MQECKDTISKLGLEFSKNLNEENTMLEFSESELEGLPADLLETLEKTSDGRRRISLKVRADAPCHRPHAHICAIVPALFPGDEDCS